MTAPPSQHSPARWLFPATIFAGAFLLFAVQPLIARFILPWFGGSPGVWTTCMLFFQILLLAGYAYAHFLTTRCSPRAQLILHLVLLVAACATLPIFPNERWKPVDSTNPTWRILALLFAAVGLTYFIVATTGPLVQSWLARVNPAASTYRLYALSNLASLGALLSYPFLIEPNFSRNAQVLTWSIAFAIFAILNAATALLTFRRAANFPTKNPPTQATHAAAPTAIQSKLLWFILPACGTILLLSTTNKICQEVAVIPFLWILPLALYLLSFVIAFDSPRWYRRALWMSLLPPALAATAITMFFGSDLPLALQLSAYALTLLITCIVCHGELARLKPATNHLTAYYLSISAGGAIGGLFIALAAPLLFTTYIEFPLGLILCATLAGVILFLDPASPLHAGKPNWLWISLITLLMLLGYTLLAAHLGTPGRVIAASRSFYGAISVIAHQEEDPAQQNVLLRHGGITHGLQFVRADRRNEPTTYYGPTSGVGRVLQTYKQNQPRHIAVVGLGAGTLATYAAPKDTWRFYEINPDVLAYAKQYFTFLKNSPAPTTHILGDARQSLEREPDQHFDILILDAFNGDAIPVHLLTRQAFDLYRRHLNPNGVIVIHISNQHLNLQPIIHGAADYLHLPRQLVTDMQPKDQSRYNSDWMILTPDAAYLNSLNLPPPPPAKSILWTDDQSSLSPLLR